MASTGPAAPPGAAHSNRKRRWWQFSILSLLVLTLVCAMGLAILASRAERQRRTVRFVEGLRGTVGYRKDPFASSPDETSRAPKWLRQTLGNDYFESVYFIDLGLTQISDAGLEHLAGLTDLKWLFLERTKVSDAGLVHLKSLTQLERLHLDGTQISDEGLLYLKGLKKLRVLHLERTHVTDTGVADLRRALPNCNIQHP